MWRRTLGSFAPAPTNRLCPARRRQSSLCRIRRPIFLPAHRRPTEKIVSAPPSFPFVLTKRSHRPLHPHISPLHGIPVSQRWSTEWVARAIFGSSHWELNLYPQDSTNLAERSGMGLSEGIDPDEVAVQWRRHTRRYPHRKSFFTTPLDRH
jgi:hypothetical protein